jgi:hypothetical protein
MSSYVTDAQPPTGRQPHRGMAMGATSAGITDNEPSVRYPIYTRANAG